jgi:hypothetical protein
MVTFGSREHVLDKTRLIGGILDDTPRCVISDICFSLGMDDEYIESKPLRKLIAEIPEIDPIEICVDDPPEQTLPHIAMFVNCNEEWNYFSLLQAFFSLVYFSPSSFRPQHHQYGPKTNTSPDSIDVCTAYRICRHFRVPLSRDTPFCEMITAIEGLSPASVYFSEHVSIKNSQSTISQEDIFLGIVNLKPTVLSYLCPSTPDEAIVFAAAVYSLDISPSKDPITEFLKIRAETSFHYAPHDEGFRRRYLVNPLHYHVRKRWIPHLQYVYSEKEIVAFAKEIGYHPERASMYRKREALERLISFVSVPNFYPGPHPNSDSCTPILRESITALSPIHYVSYGSGERFVTYTLDELRDYFERLRYFGDPFAPGQMYSPESIEHLENIVATSSESGRQLLAAIRRIRESLKGLSTFEIMWINRYTLLSEKEQQDARKVLSCVMDLGMYMRGWKVTQEKYPLTAEECMLDPSLTLERDLRVTEGFEELYHLPDKSLILDLPLLQYVSGKFFPSDSAEQGKTIGERLEIIRSGEDVHACVRLSSNYICASAYRYLDLISHKPDFDIKDLRPIS